MIKITVLVFISLAYLSAASIVYDSYYDIDTYDSYAGRVCSSSGPMCKNCNMTVLCVEVDTGEFEERGATPCAEDETCQETRCVKNFNPQCSDLADVPFRCRDIGLLPDQLDCRKYHLCAPSGENGALQAFPLYCTKGYKYNAKTTYCDLLLKDNQCYEDVSQLPVELCNTTNQMGPVSQNPTIYYFCEKVTETELLYPVLSICAHGKIFDPIKMGCVTSTTPIRPDPKIQIV